MRTWGAVILVTAALAGAAFSYRDLHQAYRGYSGAIVVTIASGMRSPDATSLLVARGVLRHHLPFFTAAIFGRTRHRLIKAGEYLFDRPLTPLEVYHKLVTGDVYLRTVLIPEGSDRFDMARIFQEQLGLNPVEFLRATEVTTAIRDLDPQAPSLEGFLFPDTYRFPHGANAAVVVAAMLARFRRLRDERFPEIRQAPASLHNLLTLASLVERETPTPAERPMVAGVFGRRLERGMMLQCDPSVVYAQRLDRLVSASIGGAMNLDAIAPASDPLIGQELQIDSPYNTYTRAGLPRGPICSPGEASIRAALHPAEGNSLYFVSNNRGGHSFASSLAEHNRNVARYRRQAPPGQRPPLRPAPSSNGTSRSETRKGQRGATRSEGDQKPERDHSTSCQKPQTDALRARRASSVNTARHTASREWQWPT